MAILTGIDEAGFGPVLGPLVVSSSVFLLPESLLRADLWRKLRKSVSNKRKHIAGRLLIADSKKSYSRAIGMKHLERTVLAALKYLGHTPAGLTEVIELLCPDCLGRLETYPWYKDARDYRVTADADDIRISSAVFADDLSSNGIKLLALRSQCLDVAHYNNLVGQVKNKARVLFSATSQLIKSAWDDFAGDNLQIIIDRQGGRAHYRKNLQRMFPDMELRILKETSTLSSYELKANGRMMNIHFVVGADNKFLPVSLASMVSKYIRELLVHNINNYFLGFHSQLKPTAGYWKDGWRFIEDLKNIPHIKYNSNQLIRCR